MSNFVKGVLYRLVKAYCADCEKELDLYRDEHVSNTLICPDCYQRLKDMRSD